MASMTPSKKPSLSASKSPKTPFKSSPKTSPAAAAAPSSPSPPADQIWTPEKTAPPIRRLRNRSVAFSVRDVKRVALALHTSPADPRPDLARSTDDLSSVEAQIAGGPNADMTPKTVKAKPTVKLPEKYEMLCEFFNCMESSIRLLRLKGSTTTFRNICTSIEHLTERRFSYSHLAQLKYLLPEAILFNKVNVHDEATCCMKSELQIYLNLEAIEMSSIKGKSESNSSNLRKVFRDRIIEFFKAHPQGDEVPEEQLPHPFNQTSIKVTRNVEFAAASQEESALVAACQQQLMVASHLSGSFQRRFSRKVPIPDSEKTPLISINRSRSEDDRYASAVTSPVKCTSKPPTQPKKSLLSSSIPWASSKCGTSGDQISHSGKPVQCCQNESDFPEGTPAKQVSTPSRLMTGTPEIPIPKRRQTAMSCDSPPPKKPARRSTRTKLFMTPTKSTNSVVEEDQDKGSSSDDDILNILPKSLLQSIKEKEKKATEEKEAGVSNAVRRQKMMASLPCMFDMILLIFQSCQRSVMTKQELMHKLMSSHSKIVDRDEAEEQFKLLQELAPDWITEKTTYGGDILCSINKISCAEEIRQRLQDAQ